MTYQQTTAVPNVLFDRHLPTLTESELKLLLVIIRQTNGWIDKATGRRKVRDRISQRQFMQKTGLCRRVVSKALKNLIGKGLVSVTDQLGNLLQAPEARKGVARLYYSFQVQPPKSKAMPLRIYGARSISEILGSY